MSSSPSSSPELPPAPGDPSAHFATAQYATHDEVLEDLSSRFILNLPDAELASVERICFQVEQAHWYYEDFIREANPKFPSLPLKKFSEMLFHACPLLHQWRNDHEQAFNTFMQYKTRVPVCGAIMLNPTWDKCVLVKGWKSSSGWGFPKGKINEDEPPASCAVREVLEETGYNLAGQVNPQHVIEMSIREQKLSLFIVPGVPEDYKFQTKTRKEISKIAWFKLADLPTWRRNRTVPGRFYLISPFIGPLKAFINEHKPRSIPRKPRTRKDPSGHLTVEDEPSHCSYTDTTQDSSSQSSTEAGEPQTPSPHYSESLPNPIPQVATQETTSDGAMTAFDPHVARLLSSLAASASANVNEPKQGVGPLSINTSRPHISEPTTPTPNTASSAKSSLENVSLDALGSSLQFSAAASFPAGLDQSSVPLQLSPPCHSSTAPADLSSAVLTRSNVLEKNQLSPTQPMASSTPLVSVGPLPTMQHHSPRPLTPRLPSKTADISPYLSRATEIHPSAKTLKQIALLESVADESARMTPLLSHRAVPSTSPYFAASPAAKPLDSARSLQSPHTPQVLYTSRFPYSTAHHTPAFGESVSQAGYELYQARPNTSYAYRRSSLQTSGSSSWSQSQLHSIMNGASTASVAAFPPSSHRPSHNVADPLRMADPLPTPPYHSMTGNVNSLLSILNGPRTGP